MKRAVHGYMRAYAGTPDVEVRRDELRLRCWAERGGYALVRIWQEEQDGGIAVLNGLVEELKRSSGAAVVVPSLRHFGSTQVLREHLAAYLVDRADVDIYEVGDE
ncbi:hypothetical protein [Streptomyces sp. NRRL F-5123]|uniref:hypothetical protein n=1 Tax=Streptomyces sp. NRRL F-5123 TaxID=1463856 RepID=UPI0004E10D96|nr:hypothetical protein [Streptomyces sp. NRRL F-5123]